MSTSHSMRITFLALCVAALAGTASIAFAAKPAPPGRMWNGGKPSAPVDVQAALDPSDASVLVVRVTPQAPCTKLVTTVHGTDGVAVDAGSAHQEDSCTMGTTVEHRISLRAPSSGVGYAAITVRLDVHGRPMSLTRAVAVGAPGATAKRVLPSGNAELKTEPSGEKVVILRSAK